MAETVTQISRTEIPDYLRKFQEEILARAQALGKDAGFVLPEYGVASLSPLQEQATSLASTGLGSYLPMLQAGADTLSSGIGTMYGGVQDSLSSLAGTTAQFDPNSVSAYMNPYEDAAVQQALTDIRRQGDQQRSGINAQATAAGAMGGSRQAVRQGQLDESVLSQQGRTAAGMRQSGYESAAQRAMGAYEGAMGRQQQAAQLGIQGSLGLGQGLGSLGMQQAQLGEAAQGLAFKDINMLSQMGSQEQAQQQALLDAERMNEYQNIMAPYQQLGFYSDIYQGMPTAQQTFSQQQQPSPSAISQIGGLGLGLYGLQQSGMFGGGS